MMSRLPKTLALVVAAFGMPAAAVTFASKARRDRSPKDWMSEAQLRDKYPGASIDAMLEEGVLESRQNPDFPERMQYYVRAGVMQAAKGHTAEVPAAGGGTPAMTVLEPWTKDWISEDKLHNQYNDTAIDQMFARGLVEVRQNPDMPERAQFVVKSGTAADAAIHRKDSELDAAPSSPMAMITEDEYQAVAAQTNDTMMKDFITRVADEMHLRVADEGGLSGFVPFFSGTTSVQCLESLKAQLLQARWVTTKDREHADFSQTQSEHAATAEASTPQPIAQNGSDLNVSAMQDSMPQFSAPQTSLQSASAPQTAASESMVQNATLAQLARNATTPEVSAPQPSAHNVSALQDSMPQFSAPQFSAPQPSLQNASAPQTAVPESMVQNATTPEAAVPQPSAQNAPAMQDSMPQFPSPQFSAPQPSLQNASAPQTAAPESMVTAPQLVENAATPEDSAPQPSAQNVSALQDSLPQFSAPRFAAPQFSAPQFSAPQFSAPQFSAPQFSAPQFAAPQFAAPQPTLYNASPPQTVASESFVQNATAPQVSVPKFSAPQDLAPQAPALEAVALQATAEIAAVPQPVEVSALQPSATSAVPPVAPASQAATSQLPPSQPAAPQVSTPQVPTLQHVQATAVAPQCNWHCYLDRYQDLQDSFGKTNVDKAAWHYYSFGRAEGRDCTCNECDWQCYLNRYQDLSNAYGQMNLVAASQHFNAFGRAEGRDCTCQALSPSPVGAASGAERVQAPEKDTHELVLQRVLGQAFGQAHVSAVTQQEVSTIVRRIQDGESPYYVVTSSLRHLPSEEQMNVLSALSFATGTFAQRESH